MKKPNKMNELKIVHSKGSAKVPIKYISRNDGLITILTMNLATTKLGIEGDLSIIINEKHLTPILEEICTEIIALNPEFGRSIIVPDDMPTKCMYKHGVQIDIPENMLNFLIEIDTISQKYGLSLCASGYGGIAVAEYNSVNKNDVLRSSIIGDLIVKSNIG